MNTEIFQKLNNNHIKNDLAFPVWIYEIRNVIVQNNRYLRLFLFNRYFDDRELNQLIISYNDKEYDLRKFSVISDYDDKNVIGCNILIPIDQDNSDVKIVKEIINGISYQASENIIEYNFPEGIFNQKKIDILKTVFKDFIVTPGVFGSYYQCCCGRINNSDEKCKCGRDIVDLNKLFEFDFDRHIIDDYYSKHPFGIEYGDVFSIAVEEYANRFRNIEPKINPQRLIEMIDNDQTRERLYSQACDLSKSDQLNNVEEANRMFYFLTGYKDSLDKKNETEAKIVVLKKKEEERIKKEKRKKTIYIISGAAAIIALILLTIFVFIPMNKYSNATKLMEQGEYEEAIDVLSEIRNYRDSETQIKECYYCIGTNQRNSGDYDSAISTFESIGDYKDSKEQIKNCKYEKAIKFYNEKEWHNAFSIFKKLEGFKDSNDYMQKCNQEYIESLTVNAPVNFGNALDQNDPNSKAAKNYVTIKSITYNVYDSDIEFNFVVNLSATLNMSFFNPPNGSYFMKTKSLSRGMNEYSFSVPIKYIVDSNYEITCKFYNFGSSNITGYIWINDMKKLINSVDLYGNKIIAYE